MQPNSPVTPASFFRSYWPLITGFGAVVSFVAIAAYTVGHDVGQENEKIYESLEKAGIDGTLSDMRAASDRLERDLSIFNENQRLRAEKQAMATKLRSLGALESQYADAKRQLLNLLGDVRTIVVSQYNSDRVSGYMPGVLLGLGEVSPNIVQLKLDGHDYSWMPGQSVTLNADHNRQLCQVALRSIDFGSFPPEATFEVTCRRKE